MENQIVRHPLLPVYDAQSRICILGTMPSLASRKNGFYYGHPQNRFWRVLSVLLQEPLPQTNEEKKRLVLKHHIALWDTLAECSVKGASDASITAPVPNDIAKLIEKTQITHIFTTGTKAYQFYTKLCQSKSCPKAIPLPSTSSANARLSVDDLCAAYRVILDYI
ncbi:MAG: DNA-deoxyinosine glycosylase [Acutalibacteraceae bacterium]